MKVVRERIKRTGVGSISYAFSTNMMKTSSSLSFSSVTVSKPLTKTFSTLPQLLSKNSEAFDVPAEKLPDTVSLAAIALSAIPPERVRALSVRDLNIFYSMKCGSIYGVEEVGVAHPQPEHEAAARGLLLPLRREPGGRERR